MNELLNEILAKVGQLSPSELSILLQAGKDMQGKAASDSLICIEDEDSVPGKNDDDLLIEKI